jgi:hypothetical protein
MILCLSHLGQQARLLATLSSLPACRIRVTFVGPKRPDSTTGSVGGHLCGGRTATDRVRALCCAYTVPRLASGGSGVQVQGPKSKVQSLRFKDHSSGSNVSCKSIPIPNRQSVHSHFNATIGSTLVARQAGMYVATSDTAISNSETTTNVEGSVGRTS